MVAKLLIRRGRGGEGVVNGFWQSTRVFFEIRGELADVETFATGSSIRELPRLRELYGKGRWRKP